MPPSRLQSLISAVPVVPKTSQRGERLKVPGSDLDQRRLAAFEREKQVEPFVHLLTRGMVELTEDPGDFSGDEKNEAVEQVNAPVEHHPSPLARLLPPIPRNAPGPEDPAFQVKEPAEASLRQDLLDHQVVGVPTAVLVDHEQPAGGRRRRDDFVKLGRREGHRFFADHVLAGPKRRHGQILVRIVGSRHQDDGDFPVVEDRVEGRIDVQPQRSRQFLPRRLHVENSSDNDGFDRGELSHVLVAHSAEPDHHEPEGRRLFRNRAQNSTALPSRAES